MRVLSTAGIVALALILDNTQGFVSPKISTFPSQNVHQLAVGDVIKAVSDNQEAVIAGGAVSSFLAGIAAFFKRDKSPSSPSTTTTPTSSSSLTPPDLSIPYDAAAQLAYQEWKTSHPTSRATYATFQPLYEMAAAADAAAKYQSAKLATVRNGAAEENPLAVPYDAAARVAYDQWRVRYQKGEFDEVGFVAFKEVYEALTVAQVTGKSAKQKLESLAGLE